MDFPSKKELIANDFGSDEKRIGESLGVETLRYLSVEKLLASVPHRNTKGESIGYCTACFTGNYPVPIDEIAMVQEHTDD
jgi:amidophosphoribosyltransferase